MIIYISTPQGEITTEHSELTALWHEILQGLQQDQDVTELTADYDKKIIELFGIGSRHCGSEQ